MNRISTCAVRIAALLGAVLVTACGSSPLKEEEKTGVRGGTILFEDHFSETGKLLVVADELGQLSISVQGLIGVDNEAIAASFHGKTLSEAYLALHPDRITVPDDLSALSEQLEAARAELPPSEVDPNAVFDSSDDLVDKSVNDFLAYACVDSETTWGGYWDAFPSTGQCVYRTTGTACTGNRLDPNDWSMGWNENNHPADHFLSASSVVYEFPAWYYGWSYWAGPYSAAKACFGFQGYGNASETHRYGVTHHNWVPIIY